MSEVALPIAVYLSTADRLPHLTLRLQCDVSNGQWPAEELIRCRIPSLVNHPQGEFQRNSHAIDMLAPESPQVTGE
jgi:hypothetical protein